MNLLGFYGGHDANIAAYSNGIVKYAKMERISGIKHEGFRSDADTILFIKKICDDWNFKPDAVAIGFWCQNPNLLWEKCETSKRESFQISDNIPIYCVDHHYCHVLSCWPILDDDVVDVGIALDNGGDNGFDSRIIANPTTNAKYLYSKSGNSIGSMLFKIGNEIMGLKGSVLDIPGKVMGAQAYGDLSRFNQNNDFEWIKQDIETRWKYTLPICLPENFAMGNQLFHDWLTSAHKIAEKYVLDLFKKYCNTNDVITYSGGCAQNTVINNVLLNFFPKLKIIPHCYDGGLSLGCLEFLRLQYNLSPLNNDGFPYWQNDCENILPTSETIHKIAYLLSKGKIVGWFQGKGAIGPRALGNRSILMDPRLKNGKDILNTKIKNREYWRPYAPSIMAEEANKWFILDKPSPYMTRTVQSKSNKIPAVIHVDNSSRIQTVKKEQNPTFYKLLCAFNKITNVPILLNTSLNLAGEPIYSTKSQCINLLNKTELDFICVGDTIYE